MPLYQFARDLMGFFYVADSPLNRDMSDYAERAFHAWMQTRNTFRKRVKAMFLIPRKGRKSTLISTNLDYEQWYEFLGQKSMVDALLSRLRHHCTTVRITGACLRPPQD